MSPTWLCLGCGRRAGADAAVTLPLSPQTHPSAWPFMEPVKKSEAPDYYEIIRFPIGGCLGAVGVTGDCSVPRCSAGQGLSQGVSRAAEWDPSGTPLAVAGGGRGTYLQGWVEGEAQ